MPQKTNANALEEIAKVLEKKPAPSSQANQKLAAKTADKHSFNASDISHTLATKEASASKSSTAREASAASSLGATSANAPRMSPSLWGELDSIMIEQYKKCWTYLGLGTDQGYTPQIKIELGPDGRLLGTPQLLNPPSDPAAKSLAESAMRAVKRCNPVKIPPHFEAYYAQWRTRITRFDPADMRE